MSELLLLRHGIAEDPGPATGWSDRERRLTQEGVRRIEAMIPFFRRVELVPDRIVASHYPRANMTASIVHQHLGLSVSLESLESLEAGRSVVPFFEQELPDLLQSSSRLMVVGHAPMLSHLASLLISGSIHARIDLKTGGMMVLQCHVSSQGCVGELSGHWEPGQLLAFLEK
jgi:phosphohistidine phosphatase